MMKTTEIMKKLYSSEINCTVESFWDADWTIKIGDHMNGFKAEEQFEDFESEEAAKWLHDEAIRLYPDSDYAGSF